MLLIAIFVLMLVSVVAIALIVNSGTETALTSNYRTSATVYYAALSGLEEVRGRLYSKDPNYVNNGANANFVPGGGLTLDQVRYIGIKPTDPTSPLYDAEYKTEFSPKDITAVPDVQAIASAAGANLDGIPGASYAWVRINAVTESAINLDVNGDGRLDKNTPLFYDPSHVDAHGTPRPGLILGPTPTAVPVFELTAMAILPNGTQKMLQYLVAAHPLSFNMPAALVLDGTSISFDAPNSSAFYIKGTDQIVAGSCNPGAGAQWDAVGYTTAPNVRIAGGPDASHDEIVGKIVALNMQPNYPGVPYAADSQGTPPTPPPAPPSVNYVGAAVTPGWPPPPTPTPFAVASNLLNADGLNSFAQTIAATASAVINPSGSPATGSDLPPTMSASNPQTVVVNGDLDLTGWAGTGYGMLLVTGKFTYGINSHWRGLVLVIGQGQVISESGSGSGDFQGGMFIARLFDDTGRSLLGASPSNPPGTSSFSPSGVNAGIYYSSCWIQASLPSSPAKVLSFREISQ